MAEISRTWPGSGGRFRGSGPSAVSDEACELQLRCLALLEEVRWPIGAICPSCGSQDVARKRDGGRLGRWNCHGCRRSFNVLNNTFLSKTRLPLATWFTMIEQVVDEDGGVPIRALAHDLELDLRTAWSMRRRIRDALAAPNPGMWPAVVARIEEGGWLTHGEVP